VVVTHVVEIGGIMEDIESIIFMALSIVILLVLVACSQDDQPTKRASAEVPTQETVFCECENAKPRVETENQRRARILSRIQQQEAEVKQLQQEGQRLLEDTER